MYPHLKRDRQKPPQHTELILMSWQEREVYPSQVLWSPVQLRNFFSRKAGASDGGKNCAAMPNDVECSGVVAAPGESGAIEETPAAMTQISSRQSNSNLEGRIRGENRLGRNSKEDSVMPSTQPVSARKKSDE
jgi:hypothetical protein